MELGGDAEKQLGLVCDEWNRAEKAIKLAEQVNGEIINPAIYELRYAGRRIVEAIQRLPDGEDSEAIALLRDAYFDCSRARHDAIDAATSKIAADLAIAVDKLGPEAVLEGFPSFSKLKSRLDVTRRLISISREDRENRARIYETLENDHLTEIVEGYNEFTASEPILRRYALRRRRGLLIERVMWLAAIIVGVWATWAFS
ncbi:hypothetical protein L0F51_10845 [Afifella sp. H1R]|uniref:hypothetical protein n=1 Tax=Afifella sp. H1R TaxID=2908841 RepID=UPI001F1783D9|nr:hypothetical protein [Afifella sp. H1R]MCF1504248.1 hypothetical protein [Afifella sp. H1R]